MSKASYALSWSGEYIITCPSSSMSIFTPVASIILFIVSPPFPITSFIFSTLIWVVTICGAYLEISSLGSEITGFIISSKIYCLAFLVLAKASSIILYDNPSTLISTWIAVIPFSVPPTLKSMSPKKSSSPWMSVSIT